MVAGGLLLSYDDLAASVGDFAGWTMGPNRGGRAWSDTEKARIDFSVQSGLRRFYYPEALDQAQAGYQWSFLQPITTASLNSGSSTLDLPEDYSGMIGVVTLQADGTATQPYKIEWSNVGKINELYSAYPAMTGPPLKVAIVSSVGTDSRVGQRFQLLFFPLSDQDYLAKFQYSISPRFLNGTAPFAYGGPAHVETILESCYAVFEERYDDQPPGTGPHSIAFRQRLVSSIAIDRRNKPAKVGYNGDRSDDRSSGGPGPFWHFASPAATYNGQSLG